MNKQKHLLFTRMSFFNLPFNEPITNRRKEPLRISAGCELLLKVEEKKHKNTFMLRNQATREKFQVPSLLVTQKTRPPMLKSHYPAVNRKLKSETITQTPGTSGVRVVILKTQQPPTH